MRGRLVPLRRAWACRAALALLLVLFVASCTTVGAHSARRQAVDYGPMATLRVCVLQAEGVSDARVAELIVAARRELAPYGIGVAVPWIRPWERQGFGHEALFEDIVRRPLEPPCDRLLAFVGRDARDFLWGLALPEVLGQVDDATHTRGFVVATRASLNQLFLPPAKVTVHEFYHLLGCPHSGSLDKCYARIAGLKRATRPGADFFPGVDAQGRWLLTREETNELLRASAVAGR